MRSRLWRTVLGPNRPDLRLVTPPRSTGTERLHAIAAEIAPGGVVVVANREPYAHEDTADGGVVIQRPASGLVTGVEPILRACGGTWVGYGGGSADRAHSDTDGRVAVPPEDPEYTLRRIWIDEDQYQRYYGGFANEALWPLCHLAFTKPHFRTADWEAYRSVNETFARAAVEEARSDGLLLIQDYHFALAPRVVRRCAPNLITNLFWHIPWPNAEIVAICPWKEELLDGMLGADVVGFHTRGSCLNFLESAQRYLECRIDLEDMSITRNGHRTLVRPYPISVAWPYPSASRAEGAALRQSLGIPREVHVSLGVDRADYTKGLIERLQAVESLLEQNDSLREKFVFVQLASPTRTQIADYRQLSQSVSELAARINDRFGTASWQPVVLHMRTFSPDEVKKYYAMANSAIVTPLHDGMNLVAKEYVAACHDCEGVLVLSAFAGAASELTGAVQVNPYDRDRFADAILRAVRMPPAERRARMTTMRERIAAHSIYDWSAELLRDLREIRNERNRVWPLRTPVSQRHRGQKS